MLRTLAFLGIAAVAARQLNKSGALDRFKDDLRTRTNDLRDRVATHRVRKPAPVTGTADVAQPV